MEVESPTTNKKPKQDVVAILADGVSHVRPIPPGGNAESVQAAYWKEREARLEKKDAEAKMKARAKDASTWRDKAMEELNVWELAEYALRLNPPMSYDTRWPQATGVANINAHKQRWGIVDQRFRAQANVEPVSDKPKRKGGRPRKNPLPVPLNAAQVG